MCEEWPRGLDVLPQGEFWGDDSVECRLRADSHFTRLTKEVCRYSLSFYRVQFCCLTKVPV